jgi:hypothetical protein
MTKKEKAEISELIKKTTQLIGRGMVEGAYDDIVAGPEYPARVLEQLERIGKRIGK